jgi:hypothetical protein
MDYFQVKSHFLALSLNTERGNRDPLHETAMSNVKGNPGARFSIKDNYNILGSLEASFEERIFFALQPG